MWLRGAIPASTTHRLVLTDGRTDRERMRGLQTQWRISTYYSFATTPNTGQSMAMPTNNSKHLVEPGDIFSRLTVLSFSHHDKRWRRHYLVRCDCGSEKTVQGTLLRSGNTKSCGCLGKEVRRNRTRLPNNGGVINQLILQYRRHARSRGIEFLLSREEFDALVRKPCHYCGDPAGNLRRTKNCQEGFPHNGIDRVDSRLPYQADNVVAACGTCNFAKGSMTGTEFIVLANRIAARNAVGMPAGTTESEK